MAGVPNETIATEVEGHVQGNGQLDDTKVTEKWAGRMLNTHQLVAISCDSNARARASFEPVQIRGRGDLRQDGAHSDNPWSETLLPSPGTQGRGVESEGLEVQALTTPTPCPQRGGEY